jgi:molybdopterin/thiamine biosynthesis adenylyltransferase
MTAAEQERYSRQILFPGLGVEGQVRIGQASICIVGCGALGSFQAEALARAGIGRLRLIDRDYVDYTNLQRQWLYDESDAQNESPKAMAAARRLQQINSHVRIEPLVKDLTPSNAEELASDCDIILDGTDNFETRYLINDLSVKLKKPWVYGAAVGSYGVVMPIVPGKGPCLACVYPEPPVGIQPTCDVNGVIAPITASVASLQVALVMRLLAGWDNFASFIHTMDVWQGTSKRVSAGAPDAACRVCSPTGTFRFLDGSKRTPVSLCGRNAVQLHDTARPLDLQALAVRLRPLGFVRVNEFALRLSVPKYDVTFFSDGRAIVKGTTDIGVARGVYAQLVGS